MELLCVWYDSNQARWVPQWQGMNHSHPMEEKPKGSEIAVFRNFVAKVMSLYNQLHPDYHTDCQRRDRLLDAVDLPAIENSLRDRTPRICQQLINRVANRMSSRKKTDGTTSTHVAGYHLYTSHPADDTVLYTL